MPLPNLSPPEPIRGLEPNSWANSTITVRFIDTVERVIAQNDFSVEVAARLQALIDEIPDGLIRPLSDPGPDLAAWNHYIEPRLDQNWLQPPWFFVEHYLYRRVIAAVGHFQPGRTHGVDPFAAIKQDGLEHGLSTIETLAERLDTWLQEDSPDQDRLKVLLYMDLWGNQSDLSLWPADNDPDEKPDHADLSQAGAYLLADDSVDVAEHLLDLDPERARVDIIVDNAAVELVGDLIVADYLLSAELVAEVRLHLKVHPTFVSDATPKDVDDTVAFLQQHADPCVRVLGERLRAHLRAGRLQLRSDFFWTSPWRGGSCPHLWPGNWPRRIWSSARVTPTTAVCWGIAIGSSPHRLPRSSPISQHRWRRCARSKPSWFVVWSLARLTLWWRKTPIGWWMVVGV